ncbi:branched-chain amino acid ABC transporter permease [Bradyrhizobium sp. 190]|uniref:branched-chain amino acid ABC transporter permease n=1 Tax=Bradyrhizobium sp. 190 TaxID=2782658 RepID=UPI001FFAA598|nr:branched-chain amino acid ABC transporter permease [Bradyrhizobium sp. 190]MCK1515039.1 branched-chain amino acid ABC transporter permease [Bradyrhizobium sp. 190]
MGFFLEVLIGGLLGGVLYALVALGFVLIFKASGILNFAQGAMVFAAGLGFAAAMEKTSAHMPFALALATSLLLATGMMLLTAWAIERFVLRPLVNQNGLTLFMATIGVAFMVEGLAQQIFGNNIRRIDVGLPKTSMFILESQFDGGILVNALDLWTAVIAALLVVALSLFFQNTRTGRALRAVADDHTAAQSVGIPLNWIWFIVWSIAGGVALVAAIVWGSKIGVQFALTFVALKALPVLIVGGLTSIPGAIVAGLLVGMGEKFAEVYLGPSLGGGIEQWFAYVLALFVLLVRPQGLFGERIIERI